MRGPEGPREQVVCHPILSCETIMMGQSSLTRKSSRRVNPFGVVGGGFGGPVSVVSLRRFLLVFEPSK